MWLLNERWELLLFWEVETASAATLAAKRDSMVHTNKGQPVSHNGCLFVYSY